MTIRYWEDEDSGHWEEKRKIEASSIGVVVGALREMRGLIHGQSHETEGHRPDSESLLELIESLLRRGEACLNDILPDECVQKDEAKRRKFDSALLFLMFPMPVAPAGTADQILANTLAHLKGKFGIKRYLGDSFWAPDYKKRLSPSVRTVDASDAIEARNRLAVPNQEAEWCIFDPIVSVIYGQRFRKSKDKADFKLQCEYFSRSLGQLTEEDNECGGFKCPELYYLESGRYVVNDTVPLLWTQANLWMATKFLSDNALLNDTGRDGAP